MASDRWYLIMERSQNFYFASPGFESQLWCSLALFLDKSPYLSVPLFPIKADNDNTYSEGGNRVECSYLSSANTE